MADFRWIGVVCIGLAGLLPACGDDSDGDQAATLTDAPSTTQSEGREDGTTQPPDELPVKRDQASLEGKLLTVGDLPSGWTISESEETEDAESEDESEFCAEAFKDFEEFDDDEGLEAESEFQKGEPSIMGGAFLSQSLAVSDEDALADAFDRLPEAFEKCREFEETDDEGSTFKGTFSPLSFDRYGDDTFAMHMSAQANSDGFEFPLAGDFVFVREDDIVMMVVSFGFGAATVPIEELEEIVDTAYAKL